MSKFLKILVNTFLIAAILTAAAILIPPLAGVSTTIVDSASMNTNLPLGSITYSTNVNVADLKVGDEVLKDNDISTYAYIIRSGDETTGQYRVVSAADVDGAEEEIYLRNSVPKVAVVVPYIGYIMIAMHSIEGIIIIALAVILMIILFILSELWKPDEEEDDEETQEAVVHAGLTEPNESAIVDTETIRAAMEANVAAVNLDAVPADEEETEEAEAHLSWSERRALKKAKKKEEKEKRAAEAMQESGDEADASENPVQAEVPSENGGEVPAEEDEPSVGEMNEVWNTEAPAENAGAVPENAEISLQVPEDEAPASEFGPKDEKLPEAPEENEPKGDTREAPFAGFTTEDISAALLEAENRADSFGDTKVLPDPESVSSYKEEISAGAPDPFDIKIAEPETFLDARAEEPVSKPYAEEAPQKETIPEEEGDRFAPVRRPSLTEMLDQAKASGESPLIVQDDETGVTVLDYSSLL